MHFMRIFINIIVFTTVLAVFFGVSFSLLMLGFHIENVVFSVKHPDYMEAVKKIEREDMKRREERLKDLEQSREGIMLPVVLTQEQV